MSFKIKINPVFSNLNQFLEQIPSDFLKSGKTIYKARNELKSFEHKGFSIVVKSFRIPIFINQIIYSFFRKSKAQRSFEYALKLQEIGISTPEAVAFIEERKGGLLKNSYYISLNKENYKDIRFYMGGDIKDDMLIDKLVSFISDFHTKGVLHLDMSPGNILFKKEHENYDFTLVDINRMIFKQNLTLKERCKSFKRLAHNPKILKVIARKYVTYNHLDTEVEQEIMKYANQFWHYD